VATWPDIKADLDIVIEFDQHGDQAFDLREEEFAILAAALPGIRIRKLRHRLHSLPGAAMLVDEFQGDLEGLIMAEAEFKTHDALAAFPNPKFAVREVTHDPRYSGGNLAGYGLPKDGQHAGWVRREAP
jgi:CYTH domain-containing protein